MVDAKNNDLLEREDNDYDTYIASDIKFSGSIKFGKPMIIKGQITGTIESTSDLVIDSMAVVTADIIANRVLIRGSVSGNIKAENLVFVMSSGSVDGDIVSAQVVLEPGSKFSGRCTMTN